MTASHQVYFVTEVFHLDVNNDVEFDKLESIDNIPAILQSVKNNMDI